MVWIRLRNQFKVGHVKGVCVLGFQVSRPVFYCKSYNNPLTCLHVCVCVQSCNWAQSQLLLCSGGTCKLRRWALIKCHDYAMIIWLFMHWLMFTFTWVWERRLAVLRTNMNAVATQCMVPVSSVYIDIHAFITLCMLEFFKPNISPKS